MALKRSKKKNMGAGARKVKKLTQAPDIRMEDGEGAENDEGDADFEMTVRFFFIYKAPLLTCSATLGISDLSSYRQESRNQRSDYSRE